MKKLLSVLLAVMLLAAIFPVAAHADGLAPSGTMGPLSWTFNSATGALKITGTGMMPNFTTSTKSPFYQNKEIKTVEIGEGVTRVGDYAFFQCILINKADLPSTLTTIGKFAFAGNSSLKTVDLPVKLATIGDQAFAASGLMNVTIPKNVTSIGTCAFAECKSLAWISALGDGSKYACDKYGVLYECAYGVKTKLLQFPVGRGETGFVIPDTVTAIGRSAFRDDPTLEVVLIPSSVTAIEPYAFMDCTALSTVGMGSGVTSIGIAAFRGCTKLWDVYVEGGESFYDTLTVGSQNEPLQDSNPINDCAFGPCSDRLMWFYDGVDKKLSILGEGRMDDYDYDMNPSDFGYYEAETAFIGRYVTGVSDYAFYFNGELRTITVDGENVRYRAVDGVLYDYNKTCLCAYPSARGDSFYSILTTATEVAPGAFGETCPDLKTVVLPKSLQLVGYGAFEYCSSLTAATYRGSKADWAKNVTVEDANDPLTDHLKYTLTAVDLNVAAPVTGETPATKLAKLPKEISLETPYSAARLTWEPADEAFAPDTAYTVHIALTLRDEYALPSDVNDVAATVNGNPAAVTKEMVTIGHSHLSYLVVSYTFPKTAATPEEPPVSAVKPGDVDKDGEITAADARLALRRAVELETYAPGSDEFIACNVDKDAEVTAADARMILRAAVELEDPTTW